MGALGTDECQPAGSRTTRARPRRFCMTLKHGPDAGHERRWGRRWDPLTRFRRTSTRPETPAPQQERHPSVRRRRVRPSSAGFGERGRGPTELAVQRQRPVPGRTPCAEPAAGRHRRKAGTSHHAVTDGSAGAPLVVDQPRGEPARERERARQPEQATECPVPVGGAQVWAPSWSWFETLTGRRLRSWGRGLRRPAAGRPPEPGRYRQRSAGAGAGGPCTVQQCSSERGSSGQ